MEHGLGKHWLRLKKQRPVGRISLKFQVYAKPLYKCQQQDNKGMAGSSNKKNTFYYTSREKTTEDYPQTTERLQVDKTGNTAERVCKD